RSENHTDRRHRPSLRSPGAAAAEHARRHRPLLSRKRGAMNMNRINHSRLVLAPIFLLLAHCGTGGGAKASAPVSVGDDAGVEGAAEAGAEESGAEPDAGVGPTGNPSGDGGGACVVEAGATDPPDDMGADTNCDGAD